MFLLCSTWVKSTKPCELTWTQLAPFTRTESIEGQARVAAAVQPPHRVADGLEHPLHLALATLVDRELDA